MSTQQQGETINSATLYNDAKKIKSAVKKNKFNATLTNTNLKSEMNKTDKQQNLSKTVNTTIPRNINLYKHLINKTFANEQEVQWVLTLRSEPERKTNMAMTGGVTHPFSFYGKTIECEQQKKTLIDFQVPHDSKNNIRHLFWKRRGPTTNSELINFETNLRRYSKQNVEPLIVKEKSWKTVPFKNRNQFATFLPNIKEEIQLKKQGKDVKPYTAYDGSLTLPKYNEKLAVKNHNEIRHLCIPGQELGMVNWQLSLRGVPSSARGFKRTSSQKKLE